MGYTDPALRAQEVLWHFLQSKPPAVYSQQYLKDKSGYWGNRDKNNDLIGLRNISCIEIDHRTSDSHFKQHSLDETSAQKWLSDNAPSYGTEKAAIKPYGSALILIGYQAEFNDSLCAFEKLQQCRLSKKSIFETLKVPESVVDRMGMEQTMSLQFPNHSRGSQNMFCYAVTGCAASIAWTHNLYTGELTAFIVVRAPGRDFSDRLAELLKLLHEFSRHAEYLPYILLDLEVCRWSETLAYFEHEAADNRRHLERFLLEPSTNSSEVFASAAVRAGALADIRVYAPSLMDMLTQLETFRSKHVHGIPQGKFAEDARFFTEAIDVRRQELSTLLGRSESLAQQTNTTISTIMGLMSFNQQTTTVEIALATRQDGTSMRTLSIVAMIYLPTTAVSAVMSIPLFDWSGSGSRQTVSPRLWILFAVTIPLTILTMVGVWYWVRCENESYRRQNRSVSRNKTSV